MSDDRPNRPKEADAELEREIREGRKFSLAEAIGRLAGPGMMKGVSPVPRKQQAEAEIASFLDRNVNSPAGAMSVVLFRRVKESELLLNNYDQPLIALAGYAQTVLDSEYLLQELVRECDVEWGNVFGERPYFEKEGCPPHRDDPYTAESARTTLCQLVEKLTAIVDHSVNRLDD
jgi:hypothetical protein